MRLSIGCELSYRLASPTPMLLNVQPIIGHGQVIEREQLVIEPMLGQTAWTDVAGNRFIRLVAQEGPLRLGFKAVATTSISLDPPEEVAEMPLGQLPMEIFPYLAPSRYCQSDKLLRFARATFCELPPGYQRVVGICNWIREYVSYEAGSTTPMTSAFDTVTERVGVCRDFAHLAIALCRALSIPSRYVSAYAHGLVPPDFHAAFEAYLRGPRGDGWYLFDPTRMVSVDQLVRIGVGRDAADIAYCSIFGAATFDPPKVWADNVGEASPATTDAVRLG